MVEKDIQLNLFGDIDDGAIHEKRKHTNARIPNFVTSGVPVGKKGFTKLVRISKDLNILTDHVSYEFNKTVTDASVAVWVLLLKIYTDTNLDAVMGLKDTEISTEMFSKQHIGKFKLAEISERIYGKKVKNKRILDLLSAISDIKINIVRGGKLIGFTRFINNAVILDDRTTIQVGFSAPMLYVLAQQMRLMNIDKYLSLHGSASRLYLVMQGNKQYNKTTGKGKYVKVDHTLLCEAMGVDPDASNTVFNLKKDFEACGINFIYHKFEKFWFYPNDAIKK